MADYYYTKYYQIESGGELLRTIFITRHAAIDYAREHDLGAIVLHKITESGAGSYSVPMIANKGGK